MCKYNVLEKLFYRRMKILIFCLQRLIFQVIIKRTFVCGLRTMLPITCPLKTLMIVVLLVSIAGEKIVQKIKVIISTCSREPLRSSGLDFIERRTYHEACCLEIFKETFTLFSAKFRKCLRYSLEVAISFLTVFAEFLLVTISSRTELTSDTF